MRAFRGFLFTISYFIGCCLFVANISHAQNRLDHSSQSNSPYTKQEKQKLEESKDVTNHGGRIGLTPVPYNPELAQRQNPTNSTTQISTPTVTGYPDIRELIKKVNRCVVSIRMLDAGGSWALSNLGFSGDSNSRATGYGSGFIISSNGHILTNEHVLRHGNKIEVELLDGSRHLAKVLFKDSKNDIALIKINANNLSPVQMGNSDDVELGEWVVGIGNPYGIGQSIMIGIVSAQKRLIPGSGYPPLIQIDAAMNLGNSGGPLFNLRGQVIGINTILLWKSQGIGFATPINMARDFLERKNYPPLKAASAPPTGPLGPESDHPRSLPERFNPFDPLWKQGQ
ncbi:MAG: S1C family serine protease [Desulfomonilaceae bacterium]